MKIFSYNFKFLVGPLNIEGEDPPLGSVMLFQARWWLGFKDLKSFNLTLLARQWWILIQNDNYLCHKVLKARYFPQHSPCKAKKYTNASYL